MAIERSIKKKTQSDAVSEAMENLGGYATFNQLNRTALEVPDVVWDTKTPFATIRRIVQQDKRFFKVRPGLWALSAERERVLTELHLAPSTPKEDSDEFDHTYYQGLLVEIGNFKRFETFVPAQDKNRRFLQKRLSDITSIKTYHDFTYEHVLRHAKTVDVTWFNSRHYPDALYEVEHSTNISHSLLKFVDLQDFNTRFRIVADVVRRREFEDQFKRAAFDPIRGRVKFLSYDDLAAWHAKEASNGANDFGD